MEDAFELGIYNPRELESKAKREVSDEKLKQSTHIITAIDDCIKPIEEYFKSGFTKELCAITSPNELSCLKLLRRFPPDTPPIKFFHYRFKLPCAGRKSIFDSWGYLWINLFRELVLHDQVQVAFQIILCY